jgi:hypothetical protein
MNSSDSSSRDDDQVAPCIWLMCSEMVIENEIKHKATRQKDVALTMALALRSEAAGASKPDWNRISNAVVGRWGLKGWMRIKEQAWKLALAREAK